MMHVRPFRIIRPKPLPRVVPIGRAMLFEGDCAEVLKRHAANSVDAIVTDPPYALISTLKRFANSPRTEASIPTAGPYVRASRGFMGEKWDTGDTAHAVEFWRECFRVLKPGGFVLAFGGTRTYHRLGCAIEDAGFEIRDMVQWLYGSGFPKSHDVSKGIDKAAGVERDIISEKANRSTFDLEKQDGGGFQRGTIQVSAPVTDAAIEWQGWGTALKPANEPICMARKPLSEGTVAANVLRWGTGAINIDGCRVASEGGAARQGEASQDRRYIEKGSTNFAALPGPRGGDPAGRWPANVITDGSDEVVAAFPNAPGQLWNSTAAPRKTGNVYGAAAGPRTDVPPRDKGGNASRFYYCAKATKKDRAGSNHPTVKPIALMRYLCRLVTPPGGIVLDPFAGTGTTGEAAHLEGFKVILIEREARFCADIRSRMAGLNVELNNAPGIA